MAKGKEHPYGDRALTRRDQTAGHQVNGLHPVSWKDQAIGDAIQAPRYDQRPRHVEVPGCRKERRWL